MKSNYFSFALLLVFSVAFSQNKATPSYFKDKIPLTLWNSTQTDTVKVYSIQMLGKKDNNINFDIKKINLSPKSFNWYTDSKRIENLKNMVSTIQKQDLCGRDLLIDIHAEVIQNIYFRSLNDR